MTTVNIPCTLSEGFFDTELYVNVGSSSAIVDRGSLRIVREPNQGKEGDGYITVFLIQRGNDQVLIELPGQPVVGGSRTWVPASQIV